MTPEDPFGNVLFLEHQSERIREGVWILKGTTGCFWCICPSLPVIPCEDRCEFGPTFTPPEVRPLGGPNTDPHKVFGGFWKTRVG